MKNLKRLWVLVAGGAFYLLGQYLRGLWFENFPINVCDYAVDSQGRFCNSPYAESLGWPLIGAGEIFLVIGIIILFANKRGWEKWLKFSYWYLPLTAVITVWAFPMPFFLNQIGRDIAVRDFGVLYITVTLLIVSWSAYAERRGKLRRTP